MSSKLTGFSRDMEIFESSGAQEETNYDDDQKSKSVEVLDNTLKSSFSVFKGKQLKSSNVDFSDSVSKPTSTAFGFHVESQEYELGVPISRDETIMQRYTRIKQEVLQLMDDVQQLKDSDKDVNVSPADIVSDLQQLQKQLHELELENVLTTSQLAGGPPSTNSLIIKDLQTQLAAVKSQPPDVNGQSGGPIYEVYANLESAKFGHLSKLSEVEHRISILENLVGGKSDNKGTVLAAGLDAEYKSLSGAVLALQAKVTLLDSTHLSGIASHLKTVLETLKEVQSAAGTSETNPEYKTKVSNALSVVSQVTPLITLVPELVDRLHALKELHEHANQLVNLVAALVKGQEALKDQIASSTALLQQVQSSVKENLDKIQNNYSDLESRLKSQS